MGNLLPTLFSFFRQPECVLLSFLPQNIKIFTKSPFQRGQQVARPTLAGVSVQEVNKMLEQFEQSQKMIKRLTKGGMGKLMRMAQSMKGVLPH